MAEYSLFTGDPRGRKCSGCQRFLMHTEIIYDWRGRLYHLGCLLDILTALAPPDPVCYSPPGDNWAP